MIKNILIISSRFPPDGGIGVRRVESFVKYLPEYGWSPYVITTGNPECTAGTSHFNGIRLPRYSNLNSSRGLCKVKALVRTFKLSPRGVIATEWINRVNQKKRDLLPVFL